MNNPQIIKEEIEECEDVTFVITTFDDGEVIFTELSES